MNIHLELAKMVCMGWSPDLPSETKRLLEAYFNGYTLNNAEKHLIGCAVRLLEKQELHGPMTVEKLLPQNIVPPNIVSEPAKKRRGCPPGGWPKKTQEEPKHD